MLFNFSHFPGVAESAPPSAIMTIIDVRAGEASVIGITAGITRRGLGYRVGVRCFAFRVSAGMGFENRALQPCSLREQTYSVFPVVG